MRYSALESDGPEDKRVSTTPVPGPQIETVVDVFFDVFVALHVEFVDVSFDVCASRTWKPISCNEDAELWFRYDVCMVVAYYL